MYVPFLPSKPRPMPELTAGSGGGIEYSSTGAGGGTGAGAPAASAARRARIRSAPFSSASQLSVRRRPAPAPTFFGCSVSSGTVLPGGSAQYVGALGGTLINSCTAAEYMPALASSRNSASMGRKVALMGAGCRCTLPDHWSKEPLLISAGSPPKARMVSVLLFMKSSSSAPADELYPWLNPKFTNTRSKPKETCDAAQLEPRDLMIDVSTRRSMSSWPPKKASST
mmetsp:Transcript_22266/g.78035  ORF Transcript_22266/g.78035 Transcript_22266/m.78035 type:complete len:226 (+) Transcript_22266:963-1640(+)